MTLLEGGGKSGLSVGGDDIGIEKGPGGKRGLQTFFLSTYPERLHNP